MRRELRENGVEMKVVKNTILRRAADKAGYEGLDETFTGPTAVAFSNDDAVAPARIIAKYAKDIEPLEIKGGVIEGTVASLEQIQEISQLPVTMAYYQCCYQCFKHLFATLLMRLRTLQNQKMMMVQPLN